MAQSLSEIRQSVTDYVVGARQRVEALTVQLREARKDLKQGEAMLRKVGGPPRKAPPAAAAGPKAPPAGLRGVVLTILRRDGPQAPGQLWEKVGVPPPPFVQRRKLIDDLVDEGLVVITGATSGTRVALREQ